MSPWSRLKTSRPGVTGTSFAWINASDSGPDPIAQLRSTLLAAEDYLGEDCENQPMAVALRTARAIQNELHEVVSIEPELACVGFRPMPGDGIPIVGYLPDIGGVYVCTMHPGVALAAVVGRLASEEIISNTLSPALAPCHPKRFFRT